MRSSARPQGYSRSIKSSQSRLVLRCVAFVLAVTCLSFDGRTQTSSPAGRNETLAEDHAEEAAGRTVKLGKLPDLHLATQPPLDGRQKQHIKDLIDRLAGLDKPDFGLSSTLSGTAFAPVPGQDEAEALLLTDHDIHTSDALKEIVAIGADALPFLLDALDDQRPTKLVETQPGFGGIMKHASELPMNAANPAERAVFKTHVETPDDPFAKGAKSYTIKVGDVCFVAIGQIVGRAYEAARYQPSMCIMLNCPAYDSKLRTDVRAIWKSGNPRRKLFDSLRADYATAGVFNGKSLDGWDDGSAFQCSAALRLMYYYPRAAGTLIARRLDKLDVRADPESDESDDSEDESMLRCVANGVRAEAFVKAVAWTRDPAVRAALARLFQRAGDVDVILAALPAIAKVGTIRRRLEPLLAALPADDRGPYGAGYDMLVALARRTPNTTKAVCERYLQGASAQRCETACAALQESKSVGARKF